MAYGADVHEDYDAGVLKEFGLEAGGYFHRGGSSGAGKQPFMALEGYLFWNQYGKRPLVVVGKTNTPYGEHLVERYGRDRNIRFVGGIYDFRKLNSIRHYSYAYFLMVIVWAERIRLCWKPWLPDVLFWHMTISSTVRSWAKMPYIMDLRMQHGDVGRNRPGGVCP